MKRLGLGIIDLEIGGYMFTERDKEMMRVIGLEAQREREGKRFRG